jgi:hypothetical protein
MLRTASILAIALGITISIVATIGWLVPIAGDAMMAYIRHDPDGPFWLRILYPLLPVFSVLVFGLIAAAWRRKVARVGSKAAAR